MIPVLIVAKVAAPVAMKVAAPLAMKVIFAVSTSLGFLGGAAGSAIKSNNDERKQRVQHQQAREKDQKEAEEHVKQAAFYRKRWQAAQAKSDDLGECIRRKVG